MRKYMLKGAVAVWFAIAPLSFSQVYKSWFIHGTGTYRTACGMLQLPVHNDSLAKIAAFVSGCAEYVKMFDGTLTLKKGYSKSEEGSAVEYEFPAFVFDTSAVSLYTDYYTILDSMRTRSMLCVLVGPRGLALNEEQLRLIDCRTISPPQWATSPPHGSGYYYAVGVSEKFYSEISSWQKALERAFASLAVSLRVSVRGLDYKSGGMTGTATEESSLRLNRAEVAARYFDPNNQLYYVLLKMPKQPE